MMETTALAGFDLFMLQQHDELHRLLCVVRDETREGMTFAELLDLLYPVSTQCRLLISLHVQVTEWADNAAAAVTLAEYEVTLAENEEQIRSLLALAQN